jgi:hypothetical protein
MLRAAEDWITAYRIRHTRADHIAKRFETVV